MFKIHKKIEYALTALKYMKGKKAGELATAGEICEKFGIPFDPTSRTLQIMAQKGILKAEQGAYGGYRIAGDLSKVTIYDLNDMIVGPMAVTKCSGKKDTCEHTSKCTLKGAMAKLNAKMLKVFREVKVSEMI
ncbi:MAG: Rrf2 family transcriptional regulator [Candidatus Omnitrophica bacterium]|nr:Rrf2 family transcriptional regulator [Candidatus Omnitrophota bacterium]